MRYSGKVFAILLAALAVISAAMFLSRQWLPRAASLHALALDRQLHWTLIDVAIVFLLAQLSLAACAWTFRAREGVRIREFPRSIRIAFIIAIVFIALELVTAATLGRSAWASMYAPAPPSVLRVEAVGQQFAFYFRYAGADQEFGPVHVEKIDPSIGNYFGLDRLHDLQAKDDIVSAELALPVNRPVELLLSSQDVVHSFYVRELRVQQDMVPGMQIPVEFTPTRIGRYEIACTQLCGLGHYRMRAFVQVLSQSDFDKWMQARER